MKEARYFYVPQADAQRELPADEALHALRVLRLRVGDEIFLMDGQGCFYRATIALATGKHCQYDICERLPQQKPWRGHIHLAIAPTKMTDRMEWLAEKATELGIDEISFLHCDNSERKVIRTDRIERIIVAAMKQSRKAWLPKVNPMVPLRDFLRRPIEGGRFIAHCHEEIERRDFYRLVASQPPTSESITILIGPEGDFSLSEVRQALSEGYLSVSLGESRLRTETAGLSAVMLSQLALRNEQE